VNMSIDICSMNISRHDWPNEDVGLSIHLYSRNSRNLSIAAITTGLHITTESSIAHYFSASISMLKKKSKRIPFIFNDKSTGSCICLRLDLYLS
jgi:hypothetical protein